MENSNYSKNYQAWQHCLDGSVIGQMLQLARKIKLYIDQGHKLSPHEILQTKTWMLVLLEYFIINPQSAQQHSALVNFIIEFLQLQHIKSIDEEPSLQEQEEQRVQEENIQQQYRLFIYEFYKIFNTATIAGETPMQNLRNNIAVRGLAQAMHLEPNHHIEYAPYKNRLNLFAPHIFAADHHNNKNIIGF